MEEVSDHKGDLKFIQRSGHKFLDNARNYREALTDFRTSTLPAEYNRTFAEAPDSNVIRDELADAYDRYTKLRNGSRNYYKHLKELTDKHTKYGNSCAVVLPWVNEAYAKLTKELQEPVAAEPDNVRSQMERVKKLHDDIVLHTKDVGKFKEHGKDLAELQDTIKDDVLSTIRDVSEKCTFMESQLAERNNHLQSALTQSYSVQEGIDGLLRWLDVAEKNTNRVVNTPIAAKKEVLLELMQDQKYVMTDIDSHKPTVDTLNETASKLMKTSDPTLARNIQAKLDGVNARFNKISNSTRNHGDYLHKMFAKLSQLEDDVEAFEDWLLPFIEKVTSKELGRVDILEMGTKLLEMQRDIDVHRNQYQDIKVLGSEVTRDPKVSDKVRVVDTLANLNKNWESLEGLMQKRLVQSLFVQSHQN